MCNKLYMCVLTSKFSILTINTSAYLVVRCCFNLLTPEHIFFYKECIAPHSYYLNSAKIHISRPDQQIWPSFWGHSTDHK